MKKTLWLLALICWGCVKKPVPQSITIHALNSRSISIAGIDHNVLVNLQQDSVNQRAWQSLLPVYVMPADTDMKDYQPPQPGNYVVQNNTVLFTPDTPFIKNKGYFLRFYRLHDDSSIWTVIRDKWKHHSPQYMERTFKP